MCVEEGSGLTSVERRNLARSAETRPLELKLGNRVNNFCVALPHSRHEPLLFFATFLLTQTLKAWLKVTDDARVGRIV